MSDDFLQRIKADPETADWQLLELTLKPLPMVVQSSLQVAAIPHWFDKRFLTEILDHQALNDFKQVNGFAILTRLSIIEASEGGFNIDEVNRKLLLDRLWQDDKDRYRELNSRAGNYCASKNQNEVRWRIETIYHKLLANEPDSVSLLSETGIKWQESKESDSAKLEALIEPIIDSAAKGRMPDGALAWAYYFRGYLDRNQQNYDQAIACLQKALEHAVHSDTSVLIPRLLEETAKVYEEKMEFHLAKSFYEFALSGYREVEDEEGEIRTVRAVDTVLRRLVEL